MNRQSYFPPFLVSPKTIAKLFVWLLVIVAISNCSSTRSRLSGLDLGSEQDIYQERNTDDSNLRLSRDLVRKDFQGKIKANAIGDSFSNSIWGSDCDCR